VRKRRRRGGACDVISSGSPTGIRPQRWSERHHGLLGHFICSRLTPRFKLLKAVSRPLEPVIADRNPKVTRRAGRQALAVSSAPNRESHLPYDVHWQEARPAA